MICELDEFLKHINKEMFDNTIKEFEKYNNEVGTYRG
jgi:hypothetical protein